MMLITPMMTAIARMTHPSKDGFFLFWCNMRCATKGCKSEADLIALGKPICDRCNIKRLDKLEKEQQKTNKTKTKEE